MKRISRFTAFVLSLIFTLIFVGSAVAIDDTTSISDITGYVANMNVK